MTASEAAAASTIEPRRLAVAVALLALLAPAAAVAQAERRSGAVLGGMVNEPGVEASADTLWRWRLYDSASPLLSEAHASLGGAAYLSPSYLALEASGVLAPLSVLEVRAGAQGLFFFGTFSSLLPLDGPGDDFSRDTRRDRSDEARSGFGARLFVEPSLQLRVGPLEARSTFGFEWWTLEPVGPWTYEPRRDVALFTDGQAVYRLDSVLLARLSPALRLGVRHELTRVPDARANDVERLGALMLLESSGRRFGLDRPLLFLNVYYYVADRYKEGGVGATAGVRISLGG